MELIAEVAFSLLWFYVACDYAIKVVRKWLLSVRASEIYKAQVRIEIDALCEEVEYE